MIEDFPAIQIRIELNHAHTKVIYFVWCGDGTTAQGFAKSKREAFTKACEVIEALPRAAQATAKPRLVK